MLWRASTSVPVDIEPVAPGVGRMTCLECEGDPAGYTEAFGDLRDKLAPLVCIDCKNRGWVYISTSPLAQIVLQWFDEAGCGTRCF